MRASASLALLFLACANGVPPSAPSAPTPAPAAPDPTPFAVRTLLPPPPANTYQNSSFATAGSVVFLPTDDADAIWSFDTANGQPLDPDGLVLPAPGLASNPAVVGQDLLAVAGWFPQQGVAVIDTADPANLQLRGVVAVPPTASVQGMEIWSADGRHAWVASFADDRLYGFDARELRLLDPGGLPLPGNPDRGLLAVSPSGPRLLLVDTQGGQVMVVDVAQPNQPRVTGVITLPGSPVFGSSNYPAVAADGRSGFLVSQQRRLYSFDLETLSLLDPHGLEFGTRGAGLSPAVLDLPDGRRQLAALSQNGVALIDASAPRALRLTGFADLGGAALLQGDARAVFSPDGRFAAFPVILPQMALAAVDAVTGRQLGLVQVGAQPNFTARLGADHIGVLCSATPDGIWMIDGLFGQLAAAAGGVTPAPGAHRGSL